MGNTKTTLDEPAAAALDATAAMLKAEADLKRALSWMRKANAQQEREQRSRRSPNSQKAAS